MSDPRGRDAGRPAGRPPHPRRRFRRRSLQVACVLGLSVGIGLLVAGLVPREPVAGPLPAATFDIAAATASGTAPASSTAPATRPSVSHRAADTDPSAAAVGGGRSVGPPTTRTSLPGTSRPDRLLIPSLGVDAPVREEALRGVELVVPGDPLVVGRWRGGAPASAASGTTLLAGHVDKQGRPGALHGLHRVGPGALVATTDAASRPAYWRVVSLQVRPKDDLPSFTTGGPRRLAIVTCGGEVVPGAPGVGYAYADNVIVVAEPHEG